MKVVLLYLYVHNNKELDECAKRFRDTYNQFPAGADHELSIVCGDGPVTDTVQKRFHGLASVFTEYPQAGWDIGAEQYMAHRTDCDFMIFMTSRTHFWKGGWLKRFVEARQQFGEGLYGSTGSYEACPQNLRKKPNPHIRTAFYGCNPALFRRYPYIIDNREKGFRFESGVWNFTQWFTDMGWRTLMVAWDGVYDKPNWRKPKEIFRRGNQTNLIAYDRHSHIYASASAHDKKVLERSADGL